MANSKLKYVRGDATRPVGDGVKLIAHCCNDIGKWGAGFSGSLSRRWIEPERMYRNMAERYGRTIPLGIVGFVNVEPNVWVANIIGQRGVRSKTNPCPISYAGLCYGFSRVSAEASHEWPFASVHMPRIGCGLAGGDWSVVEQIVVDCLCSREIDVYVYDLAGDAA